MDHTGGEAGGEKIAKPEGINGKEKAGEEERAKPGEFGAEAAAVKVLAARLDGSGSDARKADFDKFDATCHGQLAQWGAPGRKGR